MHTRTYSHAVPTSHLIHLILAAMDDTIRFWDTHDMTCVGVLEERRSEITCMTYLQCSKALITGHENGDVTMWSTPSGASSMLKLHRNTVSALAVARSRRRTFVITASYDCTVAVWDITNRTGWWCECCCDIHLCSLLCVAP
jgi:WD40 repeat protein